MKPVCVLTDDQRSLHISQIHPTQHPKLRQIMEFPVLFLGALPQDTPALYSLMNYADMNGGTWHPIGGMYAVVEGMYKLAKENGVEFVFNNSVTGITIEKGIATNVKVGDKTFPADVVISAADYQFTETRLLPKDYQSYSAHYWNKRVMAPSCLLYYVGLNRKLTHAVHHSLFFDVPFEQHGKEIYDDPAWPTNPL
ncbi:MAG: phytoene desaturase, partial [Pedobacter sp.]